MAQIHCKGSFPQGRLEIDKESILHSKLLELFPQQNKKNKEGGSILYDSLFSDSFKVFIGGDWTNKDPKSKDYKYFEANPGLLNTQDEPKLISMSGSHYFVNAKQERYFINQRTLSATDKIETINSLSLKYIQKTQNEKDSVELKAFVIKELEERYATMDSAYNQLESDLEDEIDDLEEDEILIRENQLRVLKKSMKSIKKDILDNKKSLDGIIKIIQNNLNDFNLKYIDEADVKEDDDEINTNSEIGNFTKEGSEVRDTNNIDAELKSILASIPDYIVDVDNTETPKTSKLLMLPMARPANEVKNRIVETLSNIIELELTESNYIQDPYDLMIAKLQETSNENDDSISRDFLAKIERIYNSKKTKLDKEAFKTKFVTSFYKAQNVFTISEINEKDGKLTLRHIDPASSQDKEAFIGNEFVRNIFNKFDYSSDNIKNSEDYKEARKLLVNFKTKNDIVKGLAKLDINLNYKTVNQLYNNRENVFYKIRLDKNLSLQDLFKSIFEQEIKFNDNEAADDKKVSSKGLKSIIEAYSKSDNGTQKNIVRALLDKDLFTPFNIIAKYEAINKTDLSDSSLFVGNKQRWMYSLVSGLNKEILNWKSGNLTSLKNKSHKNLIFVDYLLDLDNVKKGLYAENSNKNIAERNRRISNLKLIINSELKSTGDANPIQHKEIGEADLNMDIFFKMFNDRDEIYTTLEKSQNSQKQEALSSDMKVIFPYLFSADKSGSYSMKGFSSFENSVILDSNDELTSLGEGNQKVIKNYLLGEFEVLKRNSDLIQGYLNKTTAKQKQDYLMKYLIPDFHYATKFKNTNGNTLTYNVENDTITETDKDDNFISETKAKGLNSNFINSGSWNRWGFFNSIYEKNRSEFDLLYKFQEGVKLADPSQESHIEDVLFKLAEEEFMDVARENKSYFDSMIIVDKFGNKKSLFEVDTNIETSRLKTTPYNYAIASIFNNLEMFNLFNGDLAFYKQKGDKLSMEDALKRGPAILTDGLYIRQASVPNNQKYTTFNKEILIVDKNRYATTAVLNVLENDISKFAEQIKKGTGNNTLNYGHEIADAQGYITLDFYKRIISGTYGWSSKDNAIFERLKDKSHKYTDEDIKWLKSAGRSLQALKLTGFNLEDILDEKDNVIGQFPVYLKYSTAVLAPAIIGGTDLEKLVNQMQIQNVDQVLFKSGSKASNKPATTIFNKDENGIFTGLKDDMNLNPFLFNLSGLKLQVELPTKFDHDGVLGNQHLKNLIANLDLTDTTTKYKWRDQEFTASELQNEYDNTVKTNLQYQLNNFIEKIQIKDKTFDQTKLRELIVDQLDETADEDLIDILLDTSLPLETIPGIAQRAFPIISSYIHKHVGKVRTNAGSAIQVANIGFDRIDSPDANQIVYLTEDKELRPPLLVTNTDGSKSISKARIMMPFSSIYEQTGMSYEDFRKAFASGKIDKRIFENIIGYRIPNQSISSNDSIEVVGILPPSMGDTAIVYHEITAKTGSDFDIDKMYLMMPNFKIEENGEINYIDDVETHKGQQNKLIELMSSILTNTKTYDDLISPLDSDIQKDAINEVLYIKSILNTEDFEEEFNKFKSLKGKYKTKFLKSFSEKRKLDPIRQLSPMGLVKSRVDMLQAKKLVATMANHMTDIPMSQITNQVFKYDLKIDSFEFNKMFTLGHENNNEYKLTKIVSYLMNAAVDAAKDNYIIEGNFNSYTANGAMLMIRLGIEPVNVFKVLLNDDVLKLSKMKQMQTQKVARIQVDDYKQSLLNEYSRELVSNLQENKINFNDFIQKNEDFNSKLVLGFWNIIQLAGKELNNDIVSSKSDSNGAGKNIAEHSTLYNRMERLSKESIGSNINENFVRGRKLFKSGLDLNNIEFRPEITDDMTFLGAMMNNSLFLTNFIAKEMFVEATDNYRYIVNRISNQLGEPLPIAADNIKLISNHVYPYVMSQSGHALYNIEEDQVDYMTKEFLSEVISKKAAFPDNLMLKQLYVDASTNLISFPNYKYFDTNSKILLREAMEELYNQKDLKGNPTGVEFIHKLVQYAFLTTGFKPTYFNMNEFLPKSYFLNTGHGYFMNNLINRMNDGYSEFIEDESIEKMMTFMSINNESNYKIVANIEKPEGLISNKPITNQKMVGKVTITDTNNFYPFFKNTVYKNNKIKENLYMLTNISDELNAKKELIRVPTYSLINSNSEEVDTERNNKLRKKTKVKLFDLNTIRPENLFRGESRNKKLYLQSEIEYTSELANIFKDNNWTVLNDDLDLQKAKNMQEDNFYGRTEEEWNALSKKQQDKIKECN